MIDWFGEGYDYLAAHPVRWFLHRLAIYGAAIVIFTLGFTLTWMLWAWVAGAG